MLLTLLVIFVPGLILAWWFRRLTVPPRPWWLVVAVLVATFCFFAWPTIVAHWWFLPWTWISMNSGITVDTSPYLYRFIVAFGMAAIPEEAFKFAILLLVCVIPGMFRTPAHGVVWGALVGIGHALGENTQDLDEGAWSVLVGGWWCAETVGNGCPGRDYGVMARDRQGAPFLALVRRSILGRRHFAWAVRFWFVGCAANRFARIRRRRIAALAGSSVHVHRASSCHADYAGMRNC